MRLGGEDAAWLHMEAPDNPMIVNGWVELQGTLEPARMRRLVEERLLINARFKDRVEEPRLGMGPPRWVRSESFDVRDHVVEAKLPDASDDALRRFIGEQVSTLLDRSRPLWRVILVDRPGSGTTILYRFHHAIADGFALLAALLSLCDGAAPVAALPRAHRGRDRLVDYAASAARLVVLPPDPRTHLKGPLSVEKRVAWTRPLSLGAVKAAAHARSATVNDLLVASFAGALRRYLLRRGDDPSGKVLRAMVPVNLRAVTTPGELGNRFGLVVLGLPVGLSDPSARLADVKRRMDRLKGTPEAIVAYGLLGAMGWSPRLVERVGVSFFGAKASLVLTNVPGPRERLYVAGLPVSRIMFWVPQSGRLGLGISIFSYAGEVTVGVVSDAGLVPDPEALARDVEEELALVEDGATRSESRAS